MHLTQPPVALRYHAGISPEIITAAIELGRTGLGHPSYFNEDTMEKCSEVLPKSRMYDKPLARQGSRQPGLASIFGCIHEPHQYQCIDGLFCKAYCPGGTSAPIAKRWFYWNGFQRTLKYRGLYPEGIYKGMQAEKLKPAVEMCVPPDACRGENLCLHAYTGPLCAECKFIRD